MKYTLDYCKQYYDDIYRLYYNEKKSQAAIDEDLHLSKGATCRMMKILGLTARSDREQALKYTCNSHYFDAIDTEAKAYWFGFLSADGYITSERKHSGRKIGIAIMESDAEHLEKFKQDVDFNGNITHYISKSSYSSAPYCRIIISDEHLAQMLINKGCVEHKTGKLVFPSKEIVPEHLLRHYVRGYFDGNGSITHGSSTETSLKMSGMTEDYAKAMLSFFGKPNLALEKRHKDRDANTYCFTIGGNKQVRNILSLLYGDCAVYLNRKYDKYLTFMREYEENSGRAIW